MTQALLNNLNINTENGFGLIENGAKAVISDFEQILDSKTIEIQNSEEITDIILNVDTILPIDSNDNVQITEVIAQEIINTKNESIIESVTDTINDNIISNIGETTTEDVLSQDENQEDITNNDTENIIPQEPNITNEEINMYNEMNTLEDPTTVMILHSQIQTNVKLSAENEDIQCSQQEENVMTSQKNFDNKAAYRTFESIQPKESSIIIAARQGTEIKAEQPKNSSALNEEIVKDLNIESINSESASNESASGNLMQNQTPQEQVAKVMIQGDIKYESISNKTNMVEVKPVEIPPGKIIEQISKQMESMYNNSKLNIVLNPGTLGKVNLQVSNTTEGLTAQFTVTTQEAREILLKGLNGLKECLLAQGINVDSVSIKLDESDGEYQPDWTEQDGSKGGYKHQGAKKQKDDEKPFEQMMFEIENNDNLEIAG